MFLLFILIKPCFMKEILILWNPALWIIISMNYGCLLCSKESVWILQQFRVGNSSTLNASLCLFKHYIWLNIELVFVQMGSWSFHNFSVKRILMNCSTSVVFVSLFKWDRSSFTPFLSGPIFTAIRCNFSQFS